MNEVMELSCEDISASLRLIDGNFSIFDDNSCDYNLLVADESSECQGGSIWYLRDRHAAIRVTMGVVTVGTTVLGVSTTGIVEVIGVYELPPPPPPPGPAVLTTTGSVQLPLSRVALGL
jgi:hypothetical protein